MIYGLEEHDVNNNDLSTNQVLVELNFDLVDSILKEQIQNLDNHVNYLEPMMDKYNTIINTIEDTDVINEVNSNMRELFLNVISIMEESFDISLCGKDDFDLEQLAKITISIYDVLVIKSRKYLTKFFYKFIMKNKKVLIESYSSNIKKDLSSSALKKRVKNKDDIILLSKCPKIFKTVVFDFDISVEDFLNTISDSEFSIVILDSLVKKDMLIGNFMTKYIDLIMFRKDLYEDIYCRVFNSISKKIIKKNSLDK